MALNLRNLPHMEPLTLTDIRINDNSTPAYNLIIDSNSTTTLTGNRTLTFNVNNVNRTIALAGNLTLTGANTVATWDVSGAIEANSAGATGETGIDFNSISSTYSTICQSDAEGVASSSDLRIGLDETTRNLIICDRGDIATDFTLTASGEPSLYMFDNTVAYNAKYRYSGVTTTAGFEIEHNWGWVSELKADISAGHVNILDSSANTELTDTNGRQAWLYIEPKVLQTSTAAFDGIYLNINGTVADTYGDGTTGDGNCLLNLSESSVPAFRVQRPADAMTHDHATSAMFTDADTSDTVTVCTIPANSVIFSIRMVLVEQFVGTSLTDMDITIGDGTDADGFMTEAMNLTSDTVGDVYATRGALWNTDQGQGFFYTASSETIVATATSTGCNLNDLTAGTVRFIVTYMEA